MKVKFNVKRYFQVLGVSLAIVIAAAAVCMGIDFSGMGEDAVVDNTSTVAATDGKINVLLMGTDIDGLRTDAIMLASFDTETKAVNILSIPRDTRMYIGNRYQKINAAHAFIGEDGEIGGPTATCEAVTRLTGVPINYYVDFSFDAVAHVIDLLGPVEFTVPDLYGDGVGMIYDDPVQGLHIFLPPGDYQMTGQQAVWLLRYRHGNPDANGNFKGYVNGDTDRVEMQQKFIKAVVDQKVNASLILKIPSIFKEISSEIKTNFTARDVVKYSKYLTDFSSVNIQSHSLPGEYGSDSSNGSVWIPDMDAVREMTQTVFGYPADNITTGNPNDPSDNGYTERSSSSSSSYDDDDEEEDETSSTSSSSSGSSSSSSSASSGSSSSSSSGSSSLSSGSSSSSGNSSSLSNSLDSSSSDILSETDSSESDSSSSESTSSDETSTDSTSSDSEYSSDSSESDGE